MVQVQKMRVRRQQRLQRKYDLPGFTLNKNIMRRLHERLRLYGILLALILLWVLLIRKTRSHQVPVSFKHNQVAAAPAMYSLDRSEEEYLKSVFKKADTTADGKLTT